jgi:hypothetical protein
MNYDIFLQFYCTVGVIYFMILTDDLALGQGAELIRCSKWNKEAQKENFWTCIGREPTI